MENIEEIIEDLTEYQKIDSLLRMLNTPVYRRKLTEEMNLLVQSICEDRNITLY